ncbi:aldehyde dehydrogenase family protein [Actinomycetes bacterium KLBMP 9797]
MIDKVTQRAAEAARPFARWSAARRRDLLHEHAAKIAAAGDEIVRVVGEETGLTEARLRGELDRTTNQLRLLGDFVAAAPRPLRTSPGAAPGGADVVAVPVPLGPVAVFAASNFPLAFGVAGGDTASALAAGCPVVVKAHPAQPRTARLVASLLPQDFVFLVEGGPDVSIALVQSPPIRAVGFTGSLRGGRALMDAAAARPDPIPVYAEMGSLNPVFVLPDAAEDPSWATTLAGSVTGSAGQLCTKPGLVVLPDTPAGAALADALAAGVAAAGSGHPMLTPAMAEAHDAWLARASSLPFATVTAAEGETARPFAVQVPADELRGDLVEEHFGPTVVVSRAPLSAYPELADRLEGSLTATVIGTAADEAVAAELVPALAERVGRIVWNGVPTGVAVCDAMLHGGPWPATSAPWSTSVGTAAIARFQRPVAAQGLPPALLDAISPA